MKQYIDLVNHVLENGTRKESRTGVDTISTFNYNYEVDLRQGFPLLTTKFVSWKNIVIENLFFLSGQTNIAFLKKHKCNIWNEWADSNGNLGPIYSHQWRNFGGDYDNIPQPKPGAFARLPGEYKIEDTTDELVGREFSSNNYGDFKVVNIEKSKDNKTRYGINFKTTNYCCTALKSNILRLSVYDPYYPSLYGIARYGNVSRFKRIYDPFLLKNLVSTWRGMVRRCYSNKHRSYFRYGGKGVYVCDRWLVMENFLEDCPYILGWENKKENVGSFFLDKDGIFPGFCYSLETCRWVSRGENNSLSAMKYRYTMFHPEYGAESFSSLSDFSDKYNLNPCHLGAVTNGKGKSCGKWSLINKEPINKGFDQIKWVLNEIKNNPYSRRLIVSAWNPADLPYQALPPCHCMFIFNVQSIDGEDRLCLNLIQRSLDVSLGEAYNLAGYSFILSLFAHLSGLKPGIFSHSIVDCHVYTCKPDGTMADYDHVPGLKEQIIREPRELPLLIISNKIRTLEDIEELMKEDTATIMKYFELVGYDPHPAIKFKVAV
jgi:thymidylate synthase